MSPPKSPKVRTSIPFSSFAQRYSCFKPSTSTGEYIRRLFVHSMRNLRRPNSRAPYTFISAPAPAPAHPHAHIHTDSHPCPRTQTHKHTSTHTQTRTHAHTHTRIHTHCVAGGTGPRAWQPPSHFVQVRDFGAGLAPWHVDGSSTVCEQSCDVCELQPPVLSPFSSPTSTLPTPHPVAQQSPRPRFLVVQSSLAPL